MEPEMWDALNELLNREAKTIHNFCTEISDKRGIASMTAAVRVHILTYFRKAATESGHRAAGHGVLHLSNHANKLLRGIPLTVDSGHADDAYAAAGMRRGKNRKSPPAAVRKRWQKRTTGLSQE